jgi:hypothetical protein
VKALRDELRYAVRPEHLDALVERLEGWWFKRAVGALRGSTTPILGFEVAEKIRAIAEQLRPHALPIDFLDALPPTPADPGTDTRRFVLQMRAISVSAKRIEKAMIDYYRAFEQRSRWARDRLLLGDELVQYENRLVDEWERVSLALTEGLEPQAAEAALQELGREIFNWMEFRADIRIRPDVVEPYVMRGSFHLLADGIEPRVWWHPQFVARLEEILPAVSAGGE